MHDLQKTIELVLDYLKGIWVKKRYVMLMSWLICPIGFVYVSSMPPTYQSSARVFVDTRSLLQPLLRGIAVQSNPQQEINMIARTLKSRDNLETIARETDMDISTETSAQFDRLINSLSEDIIMSPGGRDNIYSITYRNENPELAKAVVQETLDLFVEGSLGNSRKDSDSAGRFLDEQINEYEQRLASSEQRLADFKRKYSEILPVQGTFYSNLQRLKSGLEQTKLENREAQQQLLAMKEQVKSRASAIDSFSVQDGSNSSSLSTRFDTRITALEESLDQLKLRFTDKHPDVIEAKSLLDNLRSSRKKEIDDYLKNVEASDGDVSNASPFESEIGLEIGRLEGVVASLGVRKQDFEAKISELEQKIDLVPQIEAESTALNRDYGITKSKYEELLTRKESADLSQAADISSEDLQFRIIQPPQVPADPSGPNRILLSTLVLFFGFGSGLGLAFLISQLSPILIRGHQLTALTAIPVFGQVTHLNITHIKKVERRNLAIFILSSGMVVTLYAGLLTAEIMNLNIYARVFS